MFCSAKHKLHFFIVLVLSIVLTPHWIVAQRASDPAQTHGKQAVDLVLKHIVLDPNISAPKTGKQLPTDGHWSIEKQMPPSCSRGTSQSAQACLSVNYQASEAEVSCQWVVLLKEDGSDGTIIEQNDDATRYFLQKLFPEDAKPLVLTRKRPVFPPIAQAAHVSGEVKFQIIVGQDGKLTKAALLGGPEMFRASAIEALNAWTFKPLMIGTRAVPFQTEVTFSFVSNRFGPGGSISSTP
ncbi:MAG TPA: energy transducer TonB [Edaphobacter sp.]|nr:energy transducer TonB [Edaphobacter sp.]